MQVTISDAIRYIGVDDKDIDLFESQYVVPEGVSYNSYVILDEKIAVMDTVDARGMEGWEDKLLQTLNGKKPDYLIISHLEPDHAGSIGRMVELFPEVKLVASAKAIAMLPQFFEDRLDAQEKIAVKEGEELSLGTHTLVFYMAPMVHWPEVMVTYEKSEKVLFSADGFGKFGALSLTENEDWACEARRYYFNIVGKYGMPVQTLLKKAAGLDIQKICALHGPILTENLEYYIGKYQLWSTYTPEDEGIFIAYCSLHGNTEKAARKLAEILEAKGAPKVAISDLSRDDMAECIEDAFRYDRLVLAAPTYDGGVMPAMADFINHLKMKAYQKRKVAFIENGSWAPMAAKLMKEQMSAMKDIEIVDEHVTIRSAFKQSDVAALEALAGKLL